MLIGLQMISVKDVTPKDIIGVMEEVAQVGYDGIEFARGFFGRTAQELRETCDRLNLVPFSDHVFIELMRTDFDQIVKNCHTLQMPYIAIPGPGMETHNAPEAELCRLTDEIYDLARRFKAEGLQLVLHSCMEMYERDENGVTLFDRILSKVPTDLLQAQIDTAWALVGGFEPADYIRKYAGRCDIVHIKDFKGPLPSEDVMSLRRETAYHQDAEIGRGVQNVEAIVKACKESGTKWLVVEHMEKEAYDDSIRSVQISLENIKKVL